MRKGGIPLRTVLQNFINHVESLEDGEGKKTERYEQEFQNLKKLTESLRNDPDYTSVEGEKEVNRRKNRYKDILPYDRSRVLLTKFPGVPGSDFVNGNYIRGASGSRAYIASQGPLSHTLHDFWRMVVECEVQVIIMASSETEGGKHKCECYWVEEANEERQFGNVTVTFVKSRQVCPDFLVRTLKIKYPNEKGETDERTICQFHYQMWPDHGVPVTVCPLLDMVRLVRDCQASETLPVLVHCSAGCGRTGTICAIDYVWGLLRTGKLTSDLDLFSLVQEMRKQRVAMVQTLEQYILLHQAVKALFQERLKLIDSHPYENLSQNGYPIICDNEPDYEELYLHQDKSDQSTKNSTPSNTPSALSTPSGSLNRKSNQPFPNDSIRRSASASNINTTQIPPVPQKSTRQLPLTNSHQLQDDIKTINHKNDHNFDQNLNQKSALSRPQRSKRPPIGYSKSDRESEINALKLEMRERQRKSREDISLPTTPVNSTPPSTPSTPQGLPLSSSTGHLVPQHNQTPSPEIRRKAWESQRYRLDNNSITSKQFDSLTKDSIYYQQSHLNSPELVRKNGEIILKNEETYRKNGELVRRPSLQQLKVVYEKTHSDSCLESKDIPNSNMKHQSPTPKLRRSASSITSRSHLTVHKANDLSNSLKYRRKGGVGSDEYIWKAGLDEELQICPPPPTGDSELATGSQQYGSRHQSLSPHLTYNKNENSNADNLPSISNLKGMSQSYHQGYTMENYIKQIPSYAMTTSTSPATKRKNLRICNSDVPNQGLGNFERDFRNIEDRPALPIKKSKSFRWSRPDTSSAISFVRSPDLPRKRVNYFSLDRGKHVLDSNQTLKTDLKSDMSPTKTSGAFQTRKEGLKLSVYQSLKTDDDQNDIQMKDVRPQIPPKKVIGDRYRNPIITSSSSPVRKLSQESYSPLNHFPLNPPFPRIVEGSLGTQTREQLINSENLYDKLPNKRVAVEGMEQPYTAESSQTSDGKEKLPKLLSNIEIPPVRGISKDYVNARVFKSLNSPDNGKYNYVPLPSKRMGKDKNIHDYVNCNLSGQPMLSSEESEGNNEVEKTIQPRTPIYDEVERANPPKTLIYDEFESANLPRTPIYDEVDSGNFQYPSLGSTISNDDKSESNKFSADYEFVDFGETAANSTIDEVFETVNYELLGNKEHSAKKSEQKAQNKSKEFYLTKDLDSIARQVYQDCQDYLLHGNNRSPVPSLMPKTADDKPESSKEANLEIVRNKVSVPPQGLRNRERRNSYRQAINPASPNYVKLLNRNQNHRKHQENQNINGKPLKKGIHKYEKIWFEGMREGGVFGEDYGNFLDAQGMPMPIGDGSSQQRYGQPSNEIYSDSNLSPSKEPLSFRDKMEEMRSMSFKPSSLTDLSEEELSSRNSSSTSSLVSRSAQSSRASEHTEPIYANAYPIIKPPSPGGQLSEGKNSPGLQPPKSAQKISSDSTRGIVNNHYGTIATIGHPYHKTSKNIPNYPGSNATLPARTQGISTSNFSSVNAKGYMPSASVHNQVGNHKEKDGYRSGYMQFKGASNSGEAFRVTKSPYTSIPLSSSSVLNQHRTDQVSEQAGLDVRLSGGHLEKSISSSGGNKPDEAIFQSIPNGTPYSPPPPKPPRANITTKIQMERVVGKSKVSPYLTPPPPKPVLSHSANKKTNSSTQSVHPKVSQSQSMIPNHRPPSSSTSAVPFVPQSKTFHPKRQYQVNELSRKVSLPVDAYLTNHMDGITDRQIESPPLICRSDTSATDTSEDEDGIFHKISAPSFFKKLRKNSQSNLNTKGPIRLGIGDSVYNSAGELTELKDTNTNTSSSKSASRTRHVNSKDYYRDVNNVGETRDDHVYMRQKYKNVPLSPKPLVRAFGKLKTGSKSITANFKSYLLTKGRERSDLEERENSLQMSFALTRSASSGASVNVFNVASHENNYPLSMPKDSIELESDSSSKLERTAKVSRSRQQFL